MCNLCTYPIAVEVVISPFPFIAKSAVVSDELPCVLWVFSIPTYSFVHFLFVQRVSGTSLPVSLLLSSVTFLVVTSPTNLLPVLLTSSSVSVELIFVFQILALLTNDNFSVHTNNTDSSFWRNVSLAEDSRIEQLSWVVQLTTVFRTVRGANPSTLRASPVQDSDPRCLLRGTPR